MKKLSTALRNIEDQKQGNNGFQNVYKWNGHGKNGQPTFAYRIDPEKIHINTFGSCELSEILHYFGCTDSDLYLNGGNNSKKENTISWEKSQWNRAIDLLKTRSTKHYETFSKSDIPFHFNLKVDPNYGSIVFEGKYLCFNPKKSGKQVAWVNRTRFKQDSFYNLSNISGSQSQIIIVNGTWALFALYGYYGIDGLACTSESSLPKDFAIVKDRDVAIIFDDDHAGREGARKLANKCFGAGAISVKIVTLFDNSKDDLEDYAQAGNSKEKLFELIENAPIQPMTTLPKLKPDESKSDGTDLDNSKYFLEKHSDNLKFDHRRGKWLFWTGTHWQYDESGFVKEKAKQIVDDIFILANQANDQNAIQIAKRNKQKSKISNMIDLSNSDQRVSVVKEQLDTHEFLLNCKNGTYNFQKGELQLHNKKDLLTKLVNYEYDPSAECNAWLEFLHKIFHDDDPDKETELVEYMKRAIGYCLTGSSKEQCLFLLYGTGSNGKSTLINVISHIFEQYTKSVSTDIFNPNRQSGGHNEDLARLAGSRIVTANESEVNQGFSERLLKVLTGGDTLSASMKFENVFEFKPNFKLLIAVNHKPKIRGSDYAIWRRIRLIPFENQFSKEIGNLVPDMYEKLIDESKGILNWCIQGALEWMTTGLGDIPEKIQSATDEYKRESDLLGDWLEENCEVDNAYQCTIKQLYDNYKNYTEDKNEKPISKRHFCDVLEQKKFRKTRANSARMFDGIRTRE